MQDAHKSALGPRQRVIDKDVVAGNVELELGDDGAAGRNGYGLNAPQRLAESRRRDCRRWSKISPMTWNDEVKFGPPTPKKMRMVSPTLACSGWNLDSAPTEPLKTKYSGRSFSSFSTLNS